MNIEIGMQVKRRGRPPKLISRDISHLPQSADQMENSIEINQLHFWAMRLELAANMRAGVMDSDSRHQEVANTIKDIVLSVVSEMRQC